jgi:hypothetical protein
VRRLLREGPTKDDLTPAEIKSGLTAEQRKALQRLPTSGGPDAFGARSTVAAKEPGGVRRRRHRVGVAPGRATAGSSQSHSSKPLR